MKLLLALLVVACGGTVSKSRPRASIDIEGGSVRIELDGRSTPEPQTFPIGTRFDVRAWWWGICNNDGFGSYSTASHERCDVVEHTTTATCEPNACEIESGHEFDGFWMVTVVPTKPGPVTVVITLKARSGSTKTLKQQLTITSVPKEIRE